MKFVEDERVDSINADLMGVHSRTSHIQGRLELYAGTSIDHDAKRIYATLSTQDADRYHHLIETSFDGSEPEKTGMKTYLNLITSLNSTFPDYDFTSIKPSQFRPVSFKVILDKLQSLLRPMHRGGMELFMRLSTVIPLVLKDDFLVFEVDSNGQCYAGDEETVVWEVIVSFYSRKQKLMLVLTLCCINDAGTTDDDNEFEVNSEHIGEWRRARVDSITEAIDISKETNSGDLPIVIQDSVKRKRSSADLGTVDL